MHSKSGTRCDCFIRPASTCLSQCQLALGDQRAASLLVELVSQAAIHRGGDALRLRATQLILDRYPNSFEAQQALYIAGFVEMTRRNTPKAREWWSQLLSRFPDTGFRAAVEKQLPSNAVAKVERKEPARPQDAAWPSVMSFTSARSTTPSDRTPPGSEWRLHRHWFATTACADLLGADERLAQDDTLYRGLDGLLEHKDEFFAPLRQRWSDLFGAKGGICCAPPCARTTRSCSGAVTCNWCSSRRPSAR